MVSNYFFVESSENMIPWPREICVENKKLLEQIIKLLTLYMKWDIKIFLICFGRKNSYRNLPKSRVLRKRNRCFAYTITTYIAHKLNVFTAEITPKVIIILIVLIFYYSRCILLILIYNNCNIIYEIYKIYWLNNFL